MGIQVGRHGKVSSLSIIEYNSYIANRLSKRLEDLGIKVDYLSQLGVLYNNNEVLPNLFNLKNKNSFKYSYVVNCAGSNRKFCEKFPSEGIFQTKEIIYKIHEILEYGLAKNVLHFSTIHVFGGVNYKYNKPTEFACPNDAYGNSHMIAENSLVQKLGLTENKKNFTILRLPNIFGYSSKMFGETAHLFGNQIIEMACKGLIELKAKNNISLNLFPLGLLCDFVINECIKDKYLGKTINLYHEGPTKILDYIKKISYHTQFRLVSNISTETPIYPSCKSDIQFSDFWSHFDNEIYEIFLYFQKKWK